MRNAQIDHSWEKCRDSNKDRLDIQSLLIQKEKGTHEIEIRSRVTALLGENGSGKTSILRAIQESFGDAVQNSHSYEAFCSIKGKFQGKTTEWKSKGLENPPSPIVELIDVSGISHQIKQQLEQKANIDEFLAQFGANSLAERELQIYRFACRRNYQSIKIREVEFARTATGIDEINAEGEDISDEDQVYPFFEITLADHATYDNRSMGFGELCAFYLVWKLLRSAKGTVFLLDEPDSHLSPKSRRGLTDFFAWIASDKESWVLFTSHSVEPIHQLTDSEILLIERPENPVPTRVDVAKNKQEAMLHLGMVLSRRFLFIVEDVDSRQTIQQVLSRYLPELGHVCDVQIISSGADQIVRLDSLFPKNSAACELIVVLDGDKRPEYGINERLLFLPGRQDPILIARDCAKTKPGELAVRLNTTPDNIARCIANIDGGNHHDFCMNLALELNLQGIVTESVRAAIVSIWLESMNNHEEFEQLTAAIKHRILSVDFRT